MSIRQLDAIKGQSIQLLIAHFISRIWTNENNFSILEERKNHNKIRHTTNSFMNFSGAYI